MLFFKKIIIIKRLGFLLNHFKKNLKIGIKLKKLKKIKRKLQKIRKYKDF